jgi:FlaA1/EpsC-like NDP-sugar epimerase
VSIAIELNEKVVLVTGALGSIASKTVARMIEAGVCSRVLGIQENGCLE